MEIIGIDIGTTSICGISVDAESGKVIASKTVDSNAFLEGKPFEKIQSPKKILDTAVAILDELINDDTVSIGVTGQMHGIVYTDKDGNAVSPLYTWQDERGNEPYKNTTYAKYLNSFSGYGNITDFYNRRNGVRPKEAENYCTIHDYFVMKLCSLKNPIIHITDAVSFGLYDLEKSKFNYDTNFELVSDYRIAGSYKNIPVSVAIGDNQASVFSALKEEDELLINVGTGSQVSVVSDKIINLQNIETRPYFDNKYLIVGSALCGGRAFSLLKDFYKQIYSYIGNVTDSQVYSIMGEMLKALKEPTLKADTRFAGTRNKPHITGSISGITTDNFNPCQLTYAFLDGMAEELYSMYDIMNVKGSGMVGAGNGIRKNPHLIQIAQSKFNLKLKIPEHLEEAAFGAALFGGIAARVYKDSAEAQKLIKYI